MDKVHDEEDRDKAREIYAVEVKRRKDAIAAFQAGSTPWIDKLEPEAKAYLVTTGDLDQAIRISIAISLARKQKNDPTVLSSAVLSPAIRPGDSYVDIEAATRDIAAATAHAERVLREQVAGGAARPANKSKGRAGKARTGAESTRTSGGTSGKAKAKTDIKTRRK